MRIYLQGQEHYGNRGCEALVRSTVEMLNNEFRNVEILVPSVHMESDLRQWPNAAKKGVQYTSAMSAVDSRVLWWTRIVRKAPFIFSERWFPKSHIPENISRDINSSDAVVVIGGDTITLDNSIQFLIQQLQLSEVALDAGIPTIIWAASIGPFDKYRQIEKYVCRWLSRMSAITVRESATFEYLQQLGIDNVQLVTDPAFILKPELMELDEFWPEESPKGVLGFNISPLIRNIRAQHEAESVLVQEITEFLSEVLESRDFSVLLVPHVQGFRNRDNGDSVYMERIRRKLSNFGRRITMVPDGKNATQLKYAIAKCRMFIGARTHSTIAALSSKVPTISIAYSRKAIGINKDLFGHLNYVLETPKVACKTLSKKMDLLIQDEENIREILGKYIPIWKDRAYGSINALGKVLQKDSQLRVNTTA